MRLLKRMMIRFCLFWGFLDRHLLALWWLYHQGQGFSLFVRLTLVNCQKLLFIIISLAEADKPDGGILNKPWLCLVEFNTSRKTNLLPFTFKGFLNDLVSQLLNDFFFLRGHNKILQFKKKEIIRWFIASLNINFTFL